MISPATLVIGPQESGYDPRRLPAVLDMWLRETEVFSLFEEALASLEGNTNELSALSKNFAVFKKLSPVFEDTDVGRSPAALRSILKRALPYKKILQTAGASLGVSLLSGRTASMKMKEDLVSLANEHNHLIAPKAKAWVGEGLFDGSGCRLSGEEIFFGSGYLSAFFSGKRLLTEELEYEEASKRRPEGGAFRKPVAVYVSTIGPGIDSACAELMDANDGYRACLLNAIGAGAAESAAGDLCAYLSGREGGLEGKSLRRLSPGYGDFDLSCQALIFSLLKPEKDIGVKLNEGFIMVPEKTTSGIISFRED